MKQLKAVFLKVLGCGWGIVLLHSCANIIPPGGGPRDSLPPVLVMATPKDSATNVITRNVQLTFNEFITLKSLQENLIISPTLQNTPIINHKLRNISIRFKDTLANNTTYSINFGDAIADVNEGNVARNFSYVFSTGSTIDQNTYGGKVYIAETGKIDSTLIVLLHADLSDSAVKKKRPDYYTRINGKGEFTFHHLPKGTFAVYVLPNDFTKKYDDSTKYFAFLDAPVVIGDQIQRDTLFAFQQVRRKTVGLPTGTGSRDDKRLRFQTRLDNGKQDILQPLYLSFNRPVIKIDTSQIMLCDTNYQALTGYRIRKDSLDNLYIDYPWQENTPFRLIIAKEAVADSLGANLFKTDTIAFYTNKATDYGSIRLRLSGLDLSLNPVLQFLQSGNIIESFPLTQPELIRKLYKPGDYELRILYDRNKNGKWDTGSFISIKKQPERVIQIPNRVNIRANWDNEVTIAL